MPPPMPPPRPKGPSRPKRLRDYPRWILRAVRSFLSHLFYIVRLVYEAQPWMLLLMGIFCLLGGVLPVLGAWITRDLLNAVAALLGDGLAAGSFSDFVREELLGTTVPAPASPPPAILHSTSALPLL